MGPGGGGLPIYYSSVNKYTVRCNGEGVDVVPPVLESRCVRCSSVITVLNRFLYNPTLIPTGLSPNLGATKRAQCRRESFFPMIATLQVVLRRFRFAAESVVPLCKTNKFGFMGA